MIRCMSSASQSSPTRKHHSVTKNLMHYAPSVVFRNVVGLLNTFIRPKLLSPQSFGLWSLLVVIPDYSTYLPLGSRDYMRFEIPRLEALGDEKAIQEIEASVFWGALLPNLGIALALLVLSVVSHFATEVRVGLVSVAIFVVLNNIYIHGLTLMRGRQMFRDLSHLIYFFNTTRLVLSILLIYFFEIYGLFIALPINLILALFFLRSRCPVFPSGRFSRKVYFEMIRGGFPLTVLSFMMTLMMTSGRLLIAGCLTTEEVGYYALSTLALSGLLKFPGAAREVVEPRIMEKADSLHNEGILDRYLYQPLVLNACYLPLILAPLYFLLPALVEWLLPRYIQGIVPLQIIILGFYFLATFYPLRGFVVALRLQTGTALLASLAVLINVGLSFAALKAGFGIVGVAAVNSASYALLLIFVAVLLRLRRNISFPFSKIWPVFTAFPVLCISIWGSHLLIEPWVGSGLIGALVQAALFFGVGLVLLTVAEHNMKLLKGVSPLSLFRTILQKITRS